MRVDIDQGYINHIAFVLDGSGSMEGLEDEVVKVTDNQVASLAVSSREMNQETRATVYCFDDDVNCLYYDKDVLRMPSIKGGYYQHGATALIDATMQAILDLEKSADLYGDHSYMIFVLTDGGENRSRIWTASDLKRKLNSLPPEWTVAILVPDLSCRSRAITLGFDPDNIAVWDPSKKGIEELGRKIDSAVRGYMDQRRSGGGSAVVGGIFSLSSENVAKAVSQGELVAVEPKSYRILPVRKYHVNANNSKGQGVVELAPFVVSSTGSAYMPGLSYYKLEKRELVQASKLVAVKNKKSGSVYVGEAARKMIGLDNQPRRISPVDNREFDVFIQSTSLTRHLIPDTEILQFHHEVI